MFFEILNVSRKRLAFFIDCMDIFRKANATANHKASIDCSEYVRFSNHVTLEIYAS
jgi:hypothetical protein